MYFLCGKIIGLYKERPLIWQAEFTLLLFRTELCTHRGSFLERQWLLMAFVVLGVFCFPRTLLGSSFHGLSAEDKKKHRT